MKDQPDFILLGAGFSYHAGLPLANGIREFFTRDNVRKILKFGSGESRWVDFADEAHLNNGRLGFDHVAYGYILNTLVEKFVSTRGTFTNYEDMYQFWMDSFPIAGFLDSVRNDAQQKYLAANPQLQNNPMAEYYINAFKFVDANHLYSLANHLIADLLFWRKPADDFMSRYDKFITILKAANRLTVVTLNHDLLLELMLTEYALRPYSDGFTREQNVLKADNGQSLNVFQDRFDQPISLVKLHGSIDMYRYECFIEKSDSANVISTGEFMYFKTLSYYEKQHPERYDPTSGDKVQTFHHEITPQFITGTNKPQLIASDKMYSSLIRRFENDLDSTTSLLIIGYAFGDMHVNEKIQEAMDKGKLKTIVNVNPSIPFPYTKVGIEIVNLNDVSEL